MAVLITASSYHFQLTVISHQILQQHHVHIYCAIVILQDSNIHALFHQILGVFSYKYQNFQLLQNSSPFYKKHSVSSEMECQTRLR